MPHMMIARATHDHPLFSFDNACVFFYLEEATRGTVPGASLKGYIRRKNGRGAFIAIVEQHAGEDKIKTQLKEKQHFLLNQRYTGQNNQLLEKFINQHRTAYTRLEECAKRVDLQATLLLDVPTLVSLSILTMPLFIGCLRNKRVLKRVPLDQNSLL